MLLRKRRSLRTTAGSLNPALWTLLLILTVVGLGMMAALHSSQSGSSQSSISQSGSTSITEHAPELQSLLAGPVISAGDTSSILDNDMNAQPQEALASTISGTTTTTTATNSIHFWENSQALADTNEAHPLTYTYTSFRNSGRKHALCLSGSRMELLFRTLPTLEPLVEFNDMDIFLHGYMSTDWLQEKRTLVAWLKQKWGDRLQEIRLMAWDAFENEPGSPHRRIPGFANQTAGFSELKLVSMFHRMAACHQLVMDHEHRHAPQLVYDTVMRIRPDLELLGEPNAIELQADLSKLRNDTVYFNRDSYGGLHPLHPDADDGASAWDDQDRPGVNDQLFVGHSDTMALVTHLFYGYYVYDGAHPVDMFPESALLRYVEKLGIPHGYFPVRTVRVKDVGQHQLEGARQDLSNEKL